MLLAMCPAYLLGKQNRHEGKQCPEVILHTTNCGYTSICACPATKFHRIHQQMAARIKRTSGSLPTGPSHTFPVGRASCSGAHHRLLGCNSRQPLSHHEHIRSRTSALHASNSLEYSGDCARMCGEPMKTLLSACLSWTSPQHV